MTRERQGRVKIDMCVTLTLTLFTSAKEVMFLPEFVCLFVC